MTPLAKIRYLSFALVLASGCGAPGDAAVPIGYVGGTYTTVTGNLTQPRGGLDLCASVFGSGWRVSAAGVKVSVAVDPTSVSGTTVQGSARGSLDAECTNDIEQLTLDATF